MISSSQSSSHVMILAHVKALFQELAVISFSDGLRCTWRQRGLPTGTVRGPGFEGYEDQGWTLLDVLQDHPSGLGVPALGGLHVRHVLDPLALPLGPEATLDAAAGTLTV